MAWALLTPIVSCFISNSLMHTYSRALTKCGYYICDAARTPEVPTPSAAPAGPANLFVLRGREVDCRVGFQAEF